MNRTIGVAALLVGVMTARRTRADEAAVPETPTVALPVAGGILVGAGAFMTYHYAADAKNQDARCSGFDRHCYWGFVGGSLVMDVGGALGVVWAWKLGEHDAILDLRAGQTKERRSMAIAGLLIGGLGYAVIVGGSAYVGFRSSTCATGATGATGGRTIDYACLARAEYDAAIVNLIGLPFLAVGAPIAGYGFGYGAAVDKSRESPHALHDIHVTPALRPSGGGELVLSARF